MNPKSIMRSTDLNLNRKLQRFHQKTAGRKHNQRLQRGGGGGGGVGWCVQGEAIITGGLCKLSALPESLQLLVEERTPADLPSPP